MDAAPTTRLDEHDRAEWFDVARRILPGLTEEEYAEKWDSFQQAKAEHLRLLALN